MTGRLAAVTQLRYPGFDGWRNPDLFWPDDRRWFVATGVDFWSLYIAGENAFLSELSHSVPTDSAPVALHHRLEIED